MVPSTRIRRIRQRIRTFLNPLSRVEKNKSSTNPITGESRVNPDIFESDDVANSCPVSYRTINQYGGATATTEPFSFPEAAILLVSDGDRDLWPSQRSNDWALA